MIALNFSLCEMPEFSLATLSQEPDPLVVSLATYPAAAATTWAAQEAE